MVLFWARGGRLQDGRTTLYCTNVPLSLPMWAPLQSIWALGSGHTDHKYPKITLGADSERVPPAERGARWERWTSWWRVVHRWAGGHTDHHQKGLGCPHTVLPRSILEPVTARWIPGGLQARRQHACRPCSALLGVPVSPESHGGQWSFDGCRVRVHHNLACKKARAGKLKGGMWKGEEREP